MKVIATLIKSFGTKVELLL